MNIGCMCLFGLQCKAASTFYEEGRRQYLLLHREMIKEGRRSRKVATTLLTLACSGVGTPSALSSPLVHPESSALRPRKCVQVAVKRYT